eukprot:c17298_g1_i1 orf=3-221(-)
MAMASLLSHQQLSRVHFLCFSPYHHCPSVFQLRRISCGSSSSSSLSFHGSERRRRAVCKFDLDDRKASSSSSS